MTHPHSRARQEAEVTFAKAQSKFLARFLARESALEELDAVAQARQEKTLRLKTSRLAKEREDREKTTAVVSSKPVFRI